MLQLHSFEDINSSLEEVNYGGPKQFELNKLAGSTPNIVGVLGPRDKRLVYSSNSMVFKNFRLDGHERSEELLPPHFSSFTMPTTDLN